MKLVYGCGIMDADYRVRQFEEVGKRDGKRVQRLVWVCPFYQKWVSMLRRCYSGKGYSDCVVVKEWLTFSNFKSWMEQQDWKGKELDKDLLIEGNKVYSPETCVFVSKRVNLFIVDSSKSRGVYPIGAYLHKRSGKFVAKVCDGVSQKHLGYFDTPEEAHLAWKKAKFQIALELTKEITDCKLKEALISRYEV